MPCIKNILDPALLKLLNIKIILLTAVIQRWYAYSVFHCQIRQNDLTQTTCRRKNDGASIIEELSEELSYMERQRAHTKIRSRVLFIFTNLFESLYK